VFVHVVAETGEERLRIVLLCFPNRGHRSTSSTTAPLWSVYKQTNGELWDGLSATVSSSDTASSLCKEYRGRMVGPTYKEPICLHTTSSS
jgi:hypothetical protein